MEKRYEEYAYVLDFLPARRPGFRPTGKSRLQSGSSNSMRWRRVFHLVGGIGEGRFNS